MLVETCVRASPFIYIMKWYLVMLTVSKFEQAIHLICSHPNYYIYRHQYDQYMLAETVAGWR